MPKSKRLTCLPVCACYFDHYTSSHDTTTRGCLLSADASVAAHSLQDNFVGDTSQRAVHWCADDDGPQFRNDLR